MSNDIKNVEEMEEDNSAMLSEHQELEIDSIFLDNEDTGPTLTLETMPHEDTNRQGLMRWDEALTLEGQIEAILFAAPKPLAVSEIVDVLREEDVSPDPSIVEGHILSLVKLYKERNGGFRLEYEKGVGYQFRTVPAAALLMEKMFSSRQRPLSRAALETLSIIAYRQPVTRADIEYIRGVDAGSIIKNLLDRDLIACVGRKEDSGRPMMFGTTAEFLRVFRLPTLNDLPPLSAFQPAPEIMAEAMQKLDSQQEEVDVDEFMADPELEAPNVSAGLHGDGKPEELANEFESFQVRESGTVVVDGIGNRVGASFDSEEVEKSDGRKKDQNSEVDIPDGHSFAPGSRVDDFAGTDIGQRQSDNGDGD